MNFRRSKPASTRGYHCMNLYSLFSTGNNITSGRFLYALAGLLFTVISLRVCAEGLALNDQDTFTTSRGGAFVATADNPSAIYYNPAGISQLNGHRPDEGAMELGCRLSIHIGCSSKRERQYDDGGRSIIGRTV